MVKPNPGFSVEGTDNRLVFDDFTAGTQEALRHKVNSIVADLDPIDPEDDRTKEVQHFAVQRQLSHQFEPRVQAAQCSAACALRAIVKLQGVDPETVSLRSLCLPGSFKTEDEAAVQEEKCHNAHTRVISEFEHFITPPGASEEDF